MPTVLKHARRRCKERKGIKLSKQLHQYIIKQIKQNNARFIKKERENRELWIIKCDDHIYKVVYSKEINKIITILKR